MQRKQHAKLSAREARALGDFLSHADRPEGTLSFHELQGFLFAISCAPELIQPSEWLPLISNEEDMGFADLSEAQRILGLVMVLYNQTNASVIQRTDAMPSGCRFLADTSENLKEQAPVSQWSRGFVQGHSWLEELWIEYVPDESSEMSQELGACLMALSFFSSRSMAEALYREADERERPMEPEEFARFADTMHRLFPSALASYADIGRTIAEVMRRQS
jgi:uncharacterized protein